MIPQAGAWMPSQWPSVAAGPAPQAAPTPDAAAAGAAPGACASTAAVAAALSPGWSRPQGPGAGLVNLGNSCFMNAVLQALAYLPPLGNLCLARAHSRACRLPPGGCVTCKLEETVARLLSRASPAAVAALGGGGGGGFGGGAECPEALHRALPALSRSFVRGRQEDAHELLRCLVDALERDLLRLEGRWVPGGRRLQVCLLGQGGQSPASSLHSPPTCQGACREQTAASLRAISCVALASTYRLAAVCARPHRSAPARW